MSQALVPNEQQGWCSRTNTPDGRAELIGLCVIFLRQVSGRCRRQFGLAQRNRLLTLQLVSKPAVWKPPSAGFPTAAAAPGSAGLGRRAGCCSAPGTWWSPAEQDLVRLNQTPRERNDSGPGAERAGTIPAHFPGASHFNLARSPGQTKQQGQRVPVHQRSQTPGLTRSRAGWSTGPGNLLLTLGKIRSSRTKASPHPILCQYRLLHPVQTQWLIS